MSWLEAKHVIDTTYIDDLIKESKLNPEPDTTKNTK